ncbi:WD40-repeat-containing domain protein [Entophlyctis helioformis]|nr:WD40-repeat-containing domain protein [Entophlyctis helioformis]
MHLQHLLSRPPVDPCNVASNVLVATVTEPCRISRASHDIILIAIKSQLRRNCTMSATYRRQTVGAASQAGTGANADRMDRPPLVSRKSYLRSASSSRSNLTGSSSQDAHDPHSNENDLSLASRMLHRFPRLSVSQRCDFLLALLKACDPSDMQFLGRVVPRLHRDFLSLLPLAISHRVLSFVRPSDLATVAQISRTWFSVVSNGSLWTRLYGLIGLQSMADVFYLPSNSVKTNARRLSSMGNWAHGRFRFRAFRAHSLSVLCIAFDGKTVVTGSMDRTCRVHHLKSGTLLRTLAGHEEGVYAVQFDDDKVVTGSADTTVRIWSNSDQGSLRHTLVGHTGTVTCLKFVGAVLISGSEDKTIKIWNLNGISAGDYIGGQAAAATSVSVAAGNVAAMANAHHGHGQRSNWSSSAAAASMATSGSIAKQSVQTISFENQLGLEQALASGARPSTTSKRISHVVPSSRSAIGGSDYAASAGLAGAHPADRHGGVLPIPGRPINIRTLHGHTGGIKCLDFVGHVLVSGDIHGMIRLWHIDSGNCIAVFGINKTNPAEPLIVLDERSSPLQQQQQLFKILQSSGPQSSSKTPQPMSAYKEPISSIDYRGKRLLIGTLSGALLLLDVDPPAHVPDHVTQAYEYLRVWANTPQTFGLCRQFDLHADKKPGKDARSLGGGMAASPTSPDRDTASIGGRGELSSPPPRVSIRARVPAIPVLLTTPQSGAAATAASAVSPVSPVSAGSAGSAPGSPSRRVSSWSRPAGLMAQGKWGLCAHVDEWRLMSGGTEGRCAVWNHRTGQLIYTLKGNTIDHVDGLGAVAVEAQRDENSDETGSTTYRLGAPRGSMTGRTSASVLGSLTGSILAATSAFPGSAAAAAANAAKQDDQEADRAITGVAFDDSCIVAGGMDGYIKIWQAAR